MNNKLLHHVLVYILAAIVTYYFLGLIVQDPYSSVHELGGDGLKNYYSYLQHALHGNGWWSTCMNYPYGEHIMFVDGQPLLSMTLASLRPYVHLTPSNVTAVLNLLMSFSFFLGIIFVYKLLRRYQVHTAWAIVMACCIVCLSQQNHAMFGHYGLSYVCIIPMWFYWFTLYYDGGKLKYPCYVFILTCIAMFLHPYTLAYILVWTASYVLGYFILRKETARQKFKHVLPLIISLGIAMVIFKTVGALTDPIKDRTTFPHGLWNYTTLFKDLFMSNNSIYWTYLADEKLIGEKLFGSYVYVGAATVLVLCIVLLVRLYMYIRKIQPPAVLNYSDFPKIWLFMAILCLLFSMGVPYIWNMQWVLNYVSALRQFRSLDRFGLLYYYVVSVFSAVMLYRFIIHFSARKKYLLTLLFILTVASWMFEAYALIENKIRKRSYAANYNYDLVFSRLDKKPWPDLLADEGYKPADFQAILHAPFFHIGSEKIWLQSSAWTLILSTIAAIQLDLPLVDANMSRTSWSQTFKQIKIAGGPYTYKSILYEVEDNRPYLFLTAKERLNPDDQYLISVADSITQTEQLVVYALYPEKLRQSDAAAIARFKQMTAGMKTGDSSISNNILYYNHFDDAGNDDAFYGTQSMPAIAYKDSLIASINIDKWPKNVLYECSAWFHLNDKDYSSPSLELHMFDTLWQRIDLQPVASAISGTDNHPMWFRASQYFTMREDCKVVQIYVKVGPDDTYHALDEILVRLVNDTVMSKDTRGRIMVNNHLLSR